MGYLTARYNDTSLYNRKIKFLFYLKKAYHFLSIPLHGYLQNLLFKRKRKNQIFIKDQKVIFNTMCSSSFPKDQKKESWVLVEESKILSWIKAAVASTAIPA